MKPSFLFSLFAGVFPFLLTAQNHAGEDKFICPGGSTAIGPDVPCTGCCYKWSPAAGLDNPQAANPRVSGIFESGIYAVTVSLPNGDYAVDYVTVYVYTATMSVYKPKFLSPLGLEELVPDDKKKIPGAQTMVNIDNDDQDSDFDLDDDIIQGGDNEFIKIGVILTIDLPVAANPNPAFGGSPEYQAAVQLAGGSNALGLQFWRSDDKSAGAYLLGDPLELEPIGNNMYHAFIWAESIGGHTQAQQTKLKARAFGDDSPACGDEDYISITAIEVSSIDWIGLGNGYVATGKNNSDVLDITGTQGRIANKRVFPEAKYDNGVMSPVKDKVKAYITFSTALVEDLPLYLRAFDVDDPSDNTAFIDPNDAGGAGAYPGAPTLGYTANEDNRGALGPQPDAGKAGVFTGSAVGIDPKRRCTNKWWLPGHWRLAPNSR